MATTQYQRDFVSRIDNGLLGRAACHLDDRQRKVFSQRLIRNDPKMLKQLGNELGLSTEHIRQIQGKAFECVNKIVQEEI